MLYRTYRPPAPLDRFIDNFWYWEGDPLPHRKELIMASHTMGLLVEPRRRRMQHYDGDQFDDVIDPRHCAQRPYTEHFAIDAHQPKIMGVHSRPAAHTPSLRRQRAASANEHVALEDISGAAAGRLHHRSWRRRSVEAKFRVLAEALCSRIAPPLTRHPARRAGACAISLRAASARRRVAAESGLSRRRFIEVFVEEVGVTPKLYLRLGAVQSRARLRVRYGERRLGRDRLSTATPTSRISTANSASSRLTPSQYLALRARAPPSLS